MLGSLIVYTSCTNWVTSIQLQSTNDTNFLRQLPVFILQDLDHFPGYCANIVEVDDY